MNSSIHVFGNLGNGYTQFPDDYAKDIFQAFFSKAKASSQIIVHRNNDLMYYGYIRKLDIYPQYIGFCVLYNGVLFPNLEQLFGIFEKAVTDLVVNGVILQFNEKGEIISKVSNLFEEQQEIERISTVVLSEIDKQKHATKRLPPVSYGTSSHECKLFSITDNDKEIEDASCKYSYISILKEDDYDTSVLSSYRSILKRLNKQVVDLTYRLEEQKSKNAAILRQKKQIQNVVILLIAVLLLGIILLFLRSNLIETKGKLNEAKNEISEKEMQLNKAYKDIACKDSIIMVNENTIKKWKGNYEKESKNREKAEEELESLKSTISSFQPIIVRSTDFRFSTGIYEMKYYGLASGLYSFRFRVILPDGNKEEFDRSFNVYSGENIQTITLSNNYNSTKYYVIEIMYNGHVIGGSRH